MHDLNNRKDNRKQEQQHNTSSRWTKVAAVTGIAVAAAAVLAAGSASARHHGGGPFSGGHFPITIATVEAKMQERFSAADQDASGDISLAEFQAIEGKGRKHHRMRGWRDDGSDERSAQRAEFKAAMQDTLFTLLDSNSDGTISDAEFKDGDQRQLRKQARRQVMFSHFDADGSGALSISEMPNPAARLQQADSNGDGEVTRDELRAARKAHRNSEDG